MNEPQRYVNSTAIFAAQLSSMRIGIIREGKTPPDHRVALIPEDARKLMDQFNDLEIVAQSSNLRCFPDQAYRNAGVEVVEELNDCDVIIGVKEVPLNMLLRDKTYFFFSHTLKAQPYNRELMLEILKKNIRLIDHETLTYPNGIRAIGFGRYAGIVGAYNAMLALGKREKSFNLKPAHKTSGIEEMHLELAKCQLEQTRFLVTGGGKVAHGAVETLKAAGIKEVSVEEYLNSDFKEAVFTRADLDSYYELPTHTEFQMEHFFKNSSEYKSTFSKFWKCTDVLVSSHYWDNISQPFFTWQDAASNDFKIKVIADITCDINGSIPTTIRPSTISDPIYGVNPTTKAESDPFAEDSITIMAVDNLPCEIPVDASTGFSKVMSKDIIPQFFNGDKDGILARGTMTEYGKLAERFGYLKDYVDGK